MSSSMDKGKRYTYLDYREWPDDTMYELIDGVPYAMPPSPSTEHQRIVRNLLLAIGDKLVHQCELFISPYDVILGSEEYIETNTTVVQPDLMMICDKSKIKENYCFGAPDFICEVVSPSSTSRDYIKKLHLYERFGVHEYWIIDPSVNRVFVYQMQPSGEYGRPQVYHSDQTIQTSTAITVSLTSIFT